MCSLIQTVKLVLDHVAGFSEPWRQTPLWMHARQSSNRKWDLHDVRQSTNLSHFSVSCKPLKRCRHFAARSSSFLFGWYTCMHAHRLAHGLGSSEQNHIFLDVQPCLSFITSRAIEFLHLFLRTQRELLVQTGYVHPFTSEMQPLSTFLHQYPPNCPAGEQFQVEVLVTSRYKYSCKQVCFSILISSLLILQCLGCPWSNYMLYYLFQGKISIFYREHTV